MTPANRVLEVTRLVTDGSKNACSALYAAAARIGKELGYEVIQTFILETEPGTSLKAAGWRFDGVSPGGSWANSTRPFARQDQPQCKKHRWVRHLNAPEITEE
jgi:hypothetical protein